SSLQEPSAIRRRVAHRAMYDDPPPRLASVDVGLVLPGPRVADVPNVGMAAAEKSGEIGVLHPDEPLLLVRPRLARELVGESLHHAGEVGPAVAVAGDPERALVLDPQALGGLADVVVHVVGDVEVLRRSARLEDAAALPLRRPV